MWKDEFDAMAKKTVIKLMLSKYAPLSTDMARAQEVDQAILLDEKTKYIDNLKETPQEISEEKERQRLLKYIKNAKTLEELEKCKISCTEPETVEAYEEKEKQFKTEVKAQGGGPGVDFQSSGGAGGASK